MGINKYMVWLVALVWLLAGSSAVGGEKDAAAKPADPNGKWNAQLKKYSEIYSIIHANYPEPVDEKKMIFASISGLLRALDPHSYFMDPVAMRSMNEDQQGNYFGIGTRITKYEDRLTVIAPMAGTPAYKLGIMAGDVIAEIEGKNTRDILLDDCMKMLRGAKDTYVKIKIRREGIKELLPFRIKRAEIPLNTVSFAVPYPDAPGVGYISLRTFGNTTAREIEENILRLKSKYNIHSLVLDLRGNAGGSLYAAIDLADLFLKKGKVIVSIRGRAYQNSFKAKKNNQFEDMKIAVVINRGSASASEIVAAAIQENKRGPVIGSRSWGKGLVQTISRLSLNTSVALTTAKYYTPDNKCLQRDFDQLDDYYFFFQADANKYDTDRTMVGGVIPDVHVKSPTYPKVIIPLISRGTFFRYARYLTKKSDGITQDFTANDTIMNDFLEFLKENKIRYDKNALMKHSDVLRTEIEREVLSHKFSQDEGVKVFLKADPVTGCAVKELTEKMPPREKNEKKKLKTKQT